MTYGLGNFETSISRSMCPTFQIYLVDSLYHSIDVNIIPKRRKKKEKRKQHKDFNTTNLFAL